MLKIDIITLFPQLFENNLKELPFRKAISTEKAKYNLINLRDYAVDKHGTVDSKPYGGGIGMLLMVEPIHKALLDIFSAEELEEVISNKIADTKIILMSPKGKKYSQKVANEYKDLKHLVIICGRYEGIDARVEEYVNECVSIGNYVLSGGELASLVIMESVTRLLDGVLEKEGAAQIESFSNNSLEFPQYTRPENYEGKKVPEVLLSGHHKNIEEWRSENSQVIK